MSDNSKKVKDDGTRWRVVFRYDYFDDDPQIVEDGFSSSGDAWVRAGEVQQYLPEVKSVAWDQPEATAGEPETLTLKTLVREAYANSKAHGFHELPEVEGGKAASDWQVRVNITQKLCLIHSEVSEALEDLRSSTLEALTITNHDLKRKPTGFASELADVIIRVADLCGMLDIDLEAVVREKLAYNASRPHKHGKAF